MENRLELVKRSLRLLVDRLDERDSVAIVVYGTSARTVLKPTNGSRHGVIMDAIERLEPEGSTNAEAGLRLGYRYAKQAYPRWREQPRDPLLRWRGQRGQHRCGSDPRYVQRLCRRRDLPDHGRVGMGNFNDVLLEQLADRGNGNLRLRRDTRGSAQAVRR